MPKTARAASRRPARPPVLASSLGTAVRAVAGDGGVVELVPAKPTSAAWWQQRWAQVLGLAGLMILLYVAVLLF